MIVRLYRRTILVLLAGPVLAGFVGTGSAWASSTVSNSPSKLAVHQPIVQDPPVEPDSHDTTLKPGVSKAITPPGGRKGTVDANARSFVRVPFIETHAYFDQNTSNVRW